jgi:hypothetical protein
MKDWSTFAMSDIERQIYSLHGLRVRSEIPLPAASAAGSVDLDIEWDHSAVDHHREPEGEIVASLDFPDSGYTLTRTHDGWTLRYRSIGDLSFDRALTRLQIRLFPGGARDLVPLLLAGSASALLLGLAGRCALHASAVESYGLGFGFIGNSGMGKSTLAALCCASGARLVTDDVLRLDAGGVGFCCVRGTTEIRLREHVAALADRLPAEARRRTPDRRLAVAVESVAGDGTSLALLVVPEPSRDCRKVDIKRLSQVSALYALTRYARITGWCAPEYVRRQFDFFSDVARRVPVYDVRVPWGPPFDANLGRELLEQLQALAREEVVA